MSAVFEYPVLTEEEIQAENEEFIASRKPLAPGIYDFQVTNAGYETSNNGHAQIVLQVKVWGHDGKEYSLRDWLVATKNMAFKTKHFWESVGQPDKYNGKAMVEDFENQSGKCEIINKKDKNGKLWANIKDYVQQGKKEVALDDDIPF